METLAVALRVLLSLAVVLGLLWLLHRRLSRGDRARGGTETLSIVARQNVGQKASVVVVDVDGRRFLLGVTEQSVNVLHSGDVSAEPTASAEFARSMSDANALAQESGTEFAEVAMLRPRRHGATNSRMPGSILSPVTWTQAAAALRQVR